MKLISYKKTELDPKNKKKVIILLLTEVIMALISIAYTVFLVFTMTPDNYQNYTLFTICIFGIIAIGMIVTIVLLKKITNNTLREKKSVKEEELLNEIKQAVNYQDDNE